MAVDRIQVEELFEAARGRTNVAERAAYLDEACGGDAELRSQVESLLKAHDEASGFLATIERPKSADSGEPLGSRIGPYKLLQKLGEGGMGAVYMAEQEHPVRRRVALKIIKDGMDSAKVLARFDQERQALTMMDHPHIARALDAGATDTGRPYFVMELVKGIPITQYCDQEHLTPGERLAIFIPVCQAIQHAHQKGIIHRDIKPSNVLIALYDGRPVPKVIDFGVAKATSQMLTERTMFTEVGSIVGTVEYMAPEQAELNNLDIDTRADIYSLGVLLYELLTGSPPFSSQQLRCAAFAEMLRLIREVEPPRPSTRLSSSDELASIAAHRKLEPRRLTKLVQYDLDWIVMKALEKDRGRRYETANALAEDVQRYLDDKPVLAGPPRAGYRLRKFLRRNKGPVLAAALVLFALVGGIVGTTWGLVRASQALDAETEQRQVAEKLAHEKAELAEVERQSRERADRQSELALKTLNSVVFDIQRKLDGVPGAQEVRRSLLRTAIDGLKQVARTLDTTVDADHALVWSHLNMGDVFMLAGGPKVGATEEARKQFQIAHDLAEKLAHENAHDAQLQRDLSISYLKLGDANVQLGDTAAARDAFQRFLEISQKLAQGDPKSALARSDLAVCYNRFGDLNLQLGDVAAARDAYLKELEINKKLAEDDPKDAEVQSNLAVSYSSLGDANLQLGNTAAARDAYQKQLEVSQRLAHDEPRSAPAQRGLAFSYRRMGDVDLRLGEPAAARDADQRFLEISQKLAEDDPQNAQAQRDLLVSYSNLGDVNVQLGNTAAARDAYQKCLEINLKLAHDDPENAHAQNDLSVSYEKLGDVNLQLGNVAAARDAYQKSLGIRQEQAHGDPKNAKAQRDLAIAYERQGQMNLQMKNAAAARDAHQKSLEIRQKMVHDDPRDTQAQSDLANSFGYLGNLEMGSENFSAATRWFTQSIAILEKLDQDGKVANQPLCRRLLAGQREALESCQAAERAIANLDFALGRPKQQIPDLLGIRSRRLARQGEHADAAATAEKLAALEPVSGANLFQAAQAYALCVGGMEPASQQAQRSAEETAQQNRYATRAVELLNQSHAAGYFKYPEKRAMLDQDRNLDAIRSRNDFKKLLAEILPIQAERPPAPNFTKWMYPADEHGVPGSFEKGDSEWVELKDGKIFARFKMTGTTAKYLELYDEGRQMWVRLSQTDESYSSDQKQWHRLFKGAPVHDVLPKPESKPSPPPATNPPFAQKK